MSGARQVAVAAEDLVAGQSIVSARKLFIVKAVYRDLTRDDLLHVCVLSTGGAELVLERLRAETFDVLELEASGV